MNVVVYCGSSGGSNPRFAEAARAFGSWLAARGHALVYGGSSVGLMGELSRAVLDGGGAVYGVEPRFFIEAGVAQHDLTELFVVETMAERKAKMIELGEAFVALPGGFGTLEEISEIMSRIRLGFSNRACYLLNIDGYYDHLAAFLGEMLAADFIEARNAQLVSFPRSVEELAARLEEAEKSDDAACEARPVPPEARRAAS